jgi:protocatechuate 3,4-dioxygenase beta subunit
MQKHNFRNLLLLFQMLLFIQCMPAQKEAIVEFTLIGGPCEGCEAIFEYEIDPQKSIDTLCDFNDGGAQIYIEGTVYQRDGKSPAPNVILYIYHTNQEGLYESEDDAEGWGIRHGKIRSWLKTDANGKYGFYTLRPGVYPNRAEPAHIHYTILEPNGQYYWINSVYFDDDPLLSANQRIAEKSRGGPGNILHLAEENGIFTGKRDIILGWGLESGK